MTFRTSPPATYIPPGIEEMREVAKKVGLSGFAKDLVADLCNLAAGGKISPPSDYRDTIRRRVEENLPQPDSSGEWQIPVWKDGERGKKLKCTSDRFEAIEAKTSEAMRYHQNVQDFLGGVELAKFPGSSPLEQAMSLLKLLSKQEGGTSTGEGGEPLPIFTDAERPEGVAEKLEETMDLVDQLSQDEQDMLDPDGKNHEIEKSPEGDGFRSGKGGLNRLAVAEDIVPGSDRRAMLDISRTLDSFTKLQARKQVKLEEDPAGEETRQRPIRNLGELSKVAKTAWATRQQNSSLFLYQAVSGQLPVRERVTRVVRKQAIFILVDGSGSMKGRKHWKATGVVMNRLKAVLSGDAEVFVSVFDTALGKVERATNAEEARALIKKFAAGNFTGGGTDIAASVKSAHRYVVDEIAKGGMLYRPEICVLTDEDSSVGFTPSQIPGTRVHGFAMEAKNPALKKACLATGGVGVDEF
jgi:Mg-chelatase subunit ChlD